MRKILKLAKYFGRKLSSTMYGGKEYIMQKEDGTLVVDEVELDRDELNAMTSWQDMVDMGVSRSVVGKIALEYGGRPADVDVWLEDNSRPYVEEEWEEVVNEEVVEEVADRLYREWNPDKSFGRSGGFVHLIHDFEWEFHIIGNDKDGDEWDVSFHLNPNLEEDLIDLEDTSEVRKKIKDYGDEELNYDRNIDKYREAVREMMIEVKA